MLSDNESNSFVKIITSQKIYLQKYIVEKTFEQKQLILVYFKKCHCKKEKMPAPKKSLKRQSRRNDVNDFGAKQAKLKGEPFFDFSPALGINKDGVVKTLRPIQPLRFSKCSDLDNWLDLN